jgi:hypothetical protein
MRKVTKSSTTGSMSGGVGVNKKTKTVERTGLGGKTITRTKTKTTLSAPKGTTNAGKDVRATKTLKTRTVSKGGQSATSEKMSTKANVNNLREGGDVYNKKKQTSKNYESSTGQGYSKGASRSQSLSDTAKMAKQRIMGNRLK